MRLSCVAGRECLKNMPKKTTHARSGAQRGRTRQKSFELVRPASDRDVRETIESNEEDEEQEVETAGVIKMETSAVEAESKPEPVTVAASVASAESTSKSAASRLAARRQAAQKAQQRSSANLITAEHYNYVRKDLIFILVLAIIMFSAIIIMHFVPAIGG